MDAIVLVSDFSEPGKFQSAPRRYLAEFLPGAGVISFSAKTFDGGNASEAPDQDASEPGTTFQNHALENVRPELNIGFGDF